MDAFQVQVQVRVNGRAVLPGDVRVTQPERVAERVQWAEYKFRVLGVWPGEGKHVSSELSEQRG